LAFAYAAMRYMRELLFAKLGARAEEAESGRDRGTPISRAVRQHDVAREGMFHSPSQSVAQA
jgi:hypothetical protein